MSASPEPPVPHLLAVDDDREILDLIERYFRRQGFAVTTAADGDGLRRALAAHAIDVVLLDLGLPGDDGLTLTRELRKHWNGAVIIVTGRDDSIDRVVGLELGADDYVTKPFDLRELLARVRSVLRRMPPRAASAPAGGVARFAGFRLDLRSRELVDANGRAIELTTGEFDVLRAFVEQPNRVLSRDDLMNHLHGRDAGPYDRAIDMQIGRLRRKIETDPARPALIKAVRGAGYLFAPAVERGA
ncbi:response regulator [Tahibacter soli]|uniref:Response regulator n=1 Tax=Tahibacter soli TaxID=2983605 RepID=A0A9X3YKG9_9GAMM|nr:response regulator [Tahibacter soli]MDC8012616.1 response regulator [Tahibacter soli]